MSNIIIVCVDNLDSVNKSQLKTFLNILKCEKNAEWRKMYKINNECSDAFEVELDYADKIELCFQNEIVEEDKIDCKDYSEKASELISKYYKDGVNSVVFLIDLCLDSQNTELKTGQAMIQALKEKIGDKRIEVIACTGVNELDRLTWEECLLFRRRLTADDVLNNSFPAFDKSPEINKIDKLSDDNLIAYLDYLLSHKRRNFQYFGEILLEAILFAS